RGLLALGAALARGALGQDLATAVAPACALGLGLERGVLGAEDAVALAEPSLARANVGLGELARAALGRAGERLDDDLELLARGHRELGDLEELLLAGRAEALLEVGLRLAASPASGRPLGGRGRGRRLAAQHDRGVALADRAVDRPLPRGDLLRGDLRGRDP